MINNNKSSLLKIENRILGEIFPQFCNKCDKDFVFEEIYIFRFDDKIKEELMHQKSIYDWVFPNVEDLCIYNNGYCWLNSVAHEEICDIYCETIEEYEYLKSIGIKFVEDNYVPISEENFD